MEFKSVPIEIKAVGEEGRFEGWASVFDVEDHGGDTVRRGAFVKSLGRRMPKIYMEHSTSVGVLDVAVEREKGLWVEGKPDDSTDGVNARAKLKSRALDGLSIGYSTITAKETGRFKRDLLEVDLYHVGLVPFGMNPEAVVTAVKALDVEAITNIRDLEKLLRDAGLSRKAAEIVCSPGYIAKLTQGEPDEDAAAVVDAMRRSIETLREINRRT